MYQQNASQRLSRDEAELLMSPDGSGAMSNALNEACQTFMLAIPRTHRYDPNDGRAIAKQE